jgi:hypothetical protein
MNSTSEHTAAFLTPPKKPKPAFLTNPEQMLSSLLLLKTQPPFLAIPEHKAAFLYTHPKTTAIFPQYS